MAPETQPDSGIDSTKASSKSKQKATNTSTATAKGLRQPQKKQATATGEQPKARKAHQVDESLPPLSSLDDIFDDIVGNAMEVSPVMEAMESFIGKSIRVATMCSGTESPLLAMAKMQKREHLCT